MIKGKSLVSTYYVGPTGIKNIKKVQQLLKEQIIRNTGKKRRGWGGEIQEFYRVEK